jgi:hypothetical protein
VAIIRTANSFKGINKEMGLNKTKKESSQPEKI